MNAIAELVNLANGSAAAGDTLAAKICRDAIAEIERLQLELEDTRYAVRLIIGRQNDIPWPDVPEKEVDGFLCFIRQQRKVDEAKGE